MNLMIKALTYQKSRPIHGLQLMEYGFKVVSLPP